MSKKEDALPFDLANTLFCYNKETGRITRKLTKGRGSSGSVAGTIDRHGYRMIAVHGRLYAAHRLAWMLATGNWPKLHIDHINGCKTDNCLSNLRDVTSGRNKVNATKSNNKTGYRNVSAHGKKWRSRINVGGQELRLGTFDTPEQAHAAYLAARSKYYPD